MFYKSMIWKTTLNRFPEIEKLKFKAKQLNSMFLKIATFRQRFTWIWNLYSGVSEIDILNWST